MQVVTCPECGAKNRVDERKAEQANPVCGKCGRALPLRAAGSTTHPVEATDDSLGKLLAEAGDKPVLVDCWAAWCPPCRMLAPTLDQLASESAGRYVIAKLDVDQNPRTAGEFQVSGIPTMLIFKSGKLVDQIVGLAPKPAIEARLAQHAAA